MTDETTRRHPSRTPSSASPLLTPLPGDVFSHTATLETFRTWQRFLYNEVEFNIPESPWHAAAHCERVLLHALRIGETLELGADALDTLARAAAFHDARRQDDWLDTGHGKRAADYFVEFCKSRPIAFSQQAYTLMAYHDLDDEVGLAVAEKLDAEHVASDSRTPLTPTTLLYRVFKDADALDRFRLGENACDPAYLRTEPARGMVAFAKELCEQASVTPPMPR